VLKAANESWKRRIEDKQDRSKYKRKGARKNRSWKYMALVLFYFYSVAGWMTHITNTDT
jgi:hypothetical protein